MELTITQTEEGNFKYKFVINEVNSKQIILTKEVHECIKKYFKPKTKRKEKKPAPAPKIDDVRAYFKAKGYTLDSANKFFEYYDSMNWFDGRGNPVLSWKGKANLWMKPENKIKEEVKTTSSSFFGK